MSDAKKCSAQTREFEKINSKWKKRAENKIERGECAKIKRFTEAHDTNKEDDSAPNIIESVMITYFCRKSAKEMSEGDIRKCAVSIAN